MTRREFVIKALNHIETETIPYNVEFCIEELNKLIKHTGNPDFQNGIGNFMAAAGAGTVREIKPGYFQDEFGVVWNRTKEKDIGVIESFIIDNPDCYTYKFPPIDEKLIRGRIERLLAVKADKFSRFSIGFSLFERAWTLRGMENLLIDFIENPEFVHRLMRDITDYNLKHIEIACSYPGLDAVMFGDDWGQQKGLIMGPKLWREFIKPYLKQMYGYVKSKNKYILQHSCGDIEEIMPDVIECGLDCYQTFQPEIYDIKKIKKEYGGKLSFWGGISTQFILAHGTPEDVRRVCVETIRIMRKGGGYIAAPTHSVPPDVPAENILAMLEVFQNQQLYVKGT